MIHQPAGADTLDLLEDRPRARVVFQPRMPSPAPAQILLQNAVHVTGAARRQTEGHVEDHIAGVVEDRIVIAEAHVVRIHRRSLAGLTADTARVEDFGDEHCALAFRRGREKMQVLPDRAADCARNADVVFEARPSRPHGITNQVGHAGATFRDASSIAVPCDVPGAIADHQTPESAITHQYVGSQPENEPIHTGRLGAVDGLCQIVARVCIVQEIGRTPYSKCGVWRNQGGAHKSRRREACSHRLERRGRHRSGATIGCSRHCSKQHGPGAACQLSAHPTHAHQTSPLSVTRTNFRRITVVAPLCAMMLTVASPVVAQRAELERVIKRAVLRNGLEVIAVENHGIPIATVELNVKNGAFTQRPEYEGLAHMYEHMFFKASKAYPNAEAFGQRSAELGARYNGTTQEERVNYYLSLPSDSVRGGISLIADAVRGPLFLPNELAQEKEVVLGEYDRNQASPGFEITQKMSSALYPGSASRKNTIGNRDVLRTVTPEKMKFIQNRYYVPNNMALIVTGDINPAQIFAYADSLLGDWAKGPDPFQLDPVPPIPALTQPSAIIAEADVGAVTVLIQWQGPSVRRDRASTYAADVFSDALNTKGSRFQRLLTDSGLWTAVGVNYYTLDQVGPITISGQTTPERLKEALAVLWREIDKLDDPGYFTVSELESVKAQRGTDNQFGIEKTSELTHTIGFWWAVADLDYFMGYVDNMARQTPADLQRYAARFIIGKPSVTGVLISASDRARLKLTDADVIGPVKGARVTP